MKEARLELVTVNGQPFSLMEDSGFKKIICPIVDAMGNFVAINQSNIREMVIETARIERERLSEELRDKLLMLKIDAATCRERSVLGINVQYTDGQQIVLTTLAVRELTEKHTGSYISSIVRGVLEEYNLTLNQIYSVTTDNGANMIKAVSLMTEMQGEGIQGMVDEDTDEVGESGDCDLVEDSDELEVELDSLLHGRPMLQGVRCSAHTLQLAVIDAMKDRCVSNHIAKARHVAKKLSKM